MNDRRIDRVERPRDEGLYSSRMEEKKKEKEKFSKDLPEEDKKILLATFFSYLKKMFDTFSPSKQFAGKVIDQQSIIENLQNVKKLLQKLSKENLSNSPEFATALSNAWGVLLEDFDKVEILERKHLQEIASFRKMLDAIKNYPPDSEHRFGFYLLQHAGKDWLPFPFIEILEKLHKEHLEDPKTSTLSRWFKLINKVMENLKVQMPFKPQA